jgi:hypothetical protein
MMNVVCIRKMLVKVGQHEKVVADVAVNEPDSF